MLVELVIIGYILLTLNDIKPQSLIMAVSVLSKST